MIVCCRRRHTCVHAALLRREGQRQRQQRECVQAGLCRGCAVQRAEQPGQVCGLGMGAPTPPLQRTAVGCSAPHAVEARRHAAQLVLLGGGRSAQRQRRGPRPHASGCLLPRRAWRAAAGGGQHVAPAAACSCGEHRQTLPSPEIGRTACRCRQPGVRHSVSGTLGRQLGSRAWGGAGARPMRHAAASGGSRRAQGHRQCPGIRAVRLTCWQKHDTRPLTTTVSASMCCVQMRKRCVVGKGAGGRGGRVE